MDNSKKCIHKWQHYGVGQKFNETAYANCAIDSGHTVRHFRACGECSKVEEIGISYSSKADECGRLTFGRFFTKIKQEEIT